MTLDLAAEAERILERLAADAEREYATAEAGTAYPRTAEREQRIRELHARSIEWDLARTLVAACRGDEESRELLAGLPEGMLRIFRARTARTWGPCTRCGNVWDSEQKKKPGRCGRCKSPYWDRAKGAVPMGPPRRRQAKDDTHAPHASSAARRSASSSERS